MIIYVDGACQGNGKASNKGGFGVVVLDNDENFVYNYNKLCENTTNNNKTYNKVMLNA